MAKLKEGKDEENTDEIEASIVEYFYERQVSGHKCGYCKSNDSFMTNGMWGHRLAGQDYQDLINRGWRRSGKYLYKPVMNRTCCPPYAIRCEALRFKPSRSQRRVANRMRSFLVDGKERKKQVKESEGCNKDHPNDPSQNQGEEASGEESSKATEAAPENGSKGVPEGDSVDPESSAVAQDEMSASETSKASETMAKDESKSVAEEDSENSAIAQDSENSAIAQAEMNSSETCSDRKKKTPRQGAGADPNKPQCRKAKEIRLERRKKKLAAASEQMEASTTTVSASEGDDKTAASVDKAMEDGASTEAAANAEQTPQSKQEPVPNQPHKTIEELLKLPSDQKMAHRLETKMVQCYPPSLDFTSTFLESYELYKKYQMAIHGDKEDDLSERSFRRFLCDTPLIALEGPRGWEYQYGTFHYQHYLDGKLVMVVVIDILPTYLSSVYVYYDPDYQWLDLGVYSALREIELVRLLSRVKPEFQYYCMGYYIDNNPKMSYKGNYAPSFLLCPETYRYAPIDLARQRLNVAKYSRFSDDPCEPERVLSFLGGVLILFEKQVIPYMLFRSYYGHVKDRIVVEYASLVGKQVTQRMFLYLTLDGAQQDMEDSDD